MAKTRRYSGESRKNRKEKEAREKKAYEAHKKIRKPTAPPGFFMGDRRTKRPKKMRTEDYLEEIYLEGEDNGSENVQEALDSSPETVQRTDS